MKNRMIVAVAAAAAFLLPLKASAQFAQNPPETHDSTVVLTLEDALKIALSENVSVKVADQEIERVKYARKGTYASLFPQVNASGSYQRTIKKQVMYMGGGNDEEGGGGMASMFEGLMDPVMYYIQQLMAQTGAVIPPYVPPVVERDTDSDGGIAVGRLNTYSAGLSASMPLVNFQLWESLRLSGDQVEMAVEQARNSRLGTVTSVKQAFYAVLMAKEAFNVYKSVYENAVENFSRTEKRYRVQKASELDYTRAKTNVANAIPNVYNAESSVILALWQLKAVMGVDLDKEIDVAGKLEDYADHMFFDIHENDDPDLSGNSSLRQLAIQAEQLS
ncbi:MAG: TolC family protein, partial [Bacteroidales bacterium]|nr:TolC family protein [Bacteroidales bacterium]